MSDLLFGFVPTALILGVVLLIPYLSKKYSLSMPDVKWLKKLLWPWVASGAALIIFILFWRMGGEAAPAKFKDSDGKEITYQSRPVFDKAKLTERYVVRGPIERGWQIMPDSVVILYDISKEELDVEGPLVYAGMNLALLGPVTLRAEFPQQDEPGYFLMLAGAGEQWKQIRKKSEIKVETTALFVKGLAEMRPPGPFSVRIERLRSGEQQLHIPTCKVLGPGEEWEWGLLPDSNQLNWELYVRFADPHTGATLPAEMLMAWSGGLFLGQSAEMLPLAENFLSARDDGQGEQMLTIKTPNIPGGTRVEVITKITPKY